MDTPDVSVILPTFNRAPTLSRAISSVWAQSCSSLELIVVDDGSTDDTRSVIARVQEPRLACIELTENGGVAKARNVGVNASTAQFVAFIDSDDVWLPNKLEVQLRVLEQQPDVGVVSCDMIRVHADGTESYHRSPDILPGRVTNRATRRYQPYGLGTQSVVVRRSCLESVGGFDEQFRCFEDLELFLRLSHVCRFHRIESSLVRYYHSGDGLTQSASARLAGRRRLLRLYWKDLLRENPVFLFREAAALGRRSLSDVLAPRKREQQR